MRAAANGIGRQFGQVILARHKFGRPEGRTSEIEVLAELITTVGFSPSPINHVCIETTLKATMNAVDLGQLQDALSAMHNWATIVSASC